MIAEAKDMYVTCSKPLCVGYIEGNSFRVDIKVTPGDQVAYSEGPYNKISRKPHRNAHT
jgi:hypothetical protein